jgi:two-component system, cell cycle response regulator DivK
VRNRPPSDGPLVLIVDDNPGHRELYAGFLEYHGFRIAEAADGHEGIAAARALRPDVILMDLAMPRLDGIEATRQLKSAPETSAIPIVVLTGHGLGPMKRDAEAAGCDRFLVKPILPSEVGEAVRQALKGQRSRSAAAVMPGALRARGTGVVD